MTHDECLDFADWLKETNYIFYGPRVVVLRDEAKETIGRFGLIVTPDQHKRRPKRGTVVALGLGIDEDTGLTGLQIGDKVIFNVYNTMEIRIPNRHGVKVDLEVFHAADIYIGYKADKEVEVLDTESKIETEID